MESFNDAWNNWVVMMANSFYFEYKFCNPAKWFFFSMACYLDFLFQYTEINFNIKSGNCPLSLYTAITYHDRFSSRLNSAVQDKLVIPAWFKRSNYDRLEVDKWPYSYFFTPYIGWV